MRNCDQRLPKLLTSGTWNGLPQRFPFRKPKKMVQLAVDPKLDCYELAGPLTPFHYEGFQDIEEPQPYVELSDIEDEPERLSTKAGTDEYEQPQTKKSGSSFLFCGGSKPIEKEIVHLPSSELTARQPSRLNIAGIGCLSCKPAHAYLRTDECENRCPHCLHSLPEKQKQVDPAQKKRYFWYAWLAYRENTGRLPSSSFEYNYRLFRDEPISNWNLHIVKLFN